MLARVRRWWAGRSRIERLLVAVGVPVAAIAALWGARQDRAAKAAAAAEGRDAEGGPGTEATVTGGPAGGGVHTINAGAPGVDTGQLASFTEAFAGEIGTLEKGLGSLEEQFGDTAAERAKADAERQAQFEDLRETLASTERAATKAGQRATTAEKIARAAREAAKSSSSSSSSGGDDPLARHRAIVISAYQTEGVDPPSRSTVDRIALEVKQGRSIENLRNSIRRNESKQGRKTAAQSRAYWSRQTDKAGSPGV